jgi:hypothetical protein
MRGFVLGAVTGAIAMWLWGDRVRAQFGDRLDSLVDQVLGVLDAVDDRLESLRTRVDALSTTAERPGDRRERDDMSIPGRSA